MQNTGTTILYLNSLFRFDPVYCKADVAFHGTAEGNIPNITRVGLVVPGTTIEFHSLTGAGEHGVKHATDTGWYGKGTSIAFVFSYFRNLSVSQSFTVN